MLRRIGIILTAVASMSALAACGPSSLGGSRVSGVAPVVPMSDRRLESVAQSPQWDRTSIQMVIRTQTSPSTTAVAKPSGVSVICPQVQGTNPTPSITCCQLDCPTPTPRPTPTPAVAIASMTVSVPAPVISTRRPLAAPALRPLAALAPRPYVISSGTDSVSLTVSNPAPGSPSSYAADCVLNADQTKTCTISNIGLQPGTLGTYTGSLYSGIAETGQLLGRGSSTAFIVAGQANTITTTISPVVVEVGFDFTTNVAATSAFNLVLAPGSAQTFPLTILAYDPVGNVIPTPTLGAQYLDTRALPFTIAASVLLDAQSPPGTVVLSNSTFSSPESPTTTGTYSGATLGLGASIAMSATTSDPSVFIDPPVTLTNQ
jgi:hypothetical protein